MKFIEPCRFYASWFIRLELKQRNNVTYKKTILFVHEETTSYFRINAKILLFGSPIRQMFSLNESTWCIFNMFVLYSGNCIPQWVRNIHIHLASNLRRGIVNVCCFYQMQAQWVYIVPEVIVNINLGKVLIVPCHLKWQSDVTRNGKPYT